MLSCWAWKKFYNLKARYLEMPLVRSSRLCDPHFTILELQRWIWLIEWHFVSLVCYILFIWNATSRAIGMTVESTVYYRNTETKQFHKWHFLRPCSIYHISCKSRLCDPHFTRLEIQRLSWLHHECHFVSIVCYILFIWNATSLAIDMAVRSTVYYRNTET